MTGGRYLKFFPPRESSFLLLTGGARSSHPPDRLPYLSQVEVRADPLYTAANTGYLRTRVRKDDVPSLAQLDRSPQVWVYERAFVSAKAEQ